MKYVVYWKKRVEGKIVDSGRNVCPNEEVLAATIQNLHIDPEYMRIRKNVEIKVFPYFEEGQMVLNIKTLQTRIVRSVITMDEMGFNVGKLIVYNNDNPAEVELQKNGYMPIIHEEWDMHNCVPFDWKKAHDEHYFQIGTEMGMNSKYAKIQAREMSEW